MPISTMQMLRLNLLQTIFSPLTHALYTDLDLAIILTQLHSLYLNDPSSHKKNAPSTKDPTVHNKHTYHQTDCAYPDKSTNQGISS